MYNEILAKKVLTFVIPTLTLDTTLRVNIYDFEKRQTLWHLLKSTMEKIEIPLIRQFEKDPTKHHLNQATISLLTIKLQEDKQLLAQIELFLDQQQDIECAEKGNTKSDLSFGVTRPHNVSTAYSYKVQNSFRTEWKRRRSHF